MRRASILALIAAATLGGCAGFPAQAARSAMTWVRADDDEGARLALGVPDSEDVFLMFACRPRSGAIRLTVVGREGDGAAIELHSGKTWNRYPGAGEADEATDGAFDIQTTLDAEDPVLRRIADTGELSVVLGQRRVATPNAFAPFHDFLEACRGRR